MSPDVSSVVELSLCLSLALGLTTWASEPLRTGALPDILVFDAGLLDTRDRRDDRCVGPVASVVVLRPGTVDDVAAEAEGLVEEAADGLLLATAGALVLDVDVVETPFVASCFVGDFAGDRMPLLILVAGVGVLMIALDLLPGPSDTSVCLLVVPLTVP